MDGDPSNRRSGAFDLPTVHPRPGREPDPAIRALDCAGAADRRGRAVERRQEPITGGVDFDSMMPLELAACMSVVLLEEMAPGRVAEERGALGRFHDVEHED